MLEPSSQKGRSAREGRCGSDLGSEAPVQTDRFGFILANGSTAECTGPPPELVRQREAKWRDIISQWDRFLQGKNSKLKEQCQKGIPASLRAKCWPKLCGATEHMEAHVNLYQSLDSTPALQSWVDVIERDLDRQFPFHEMFLSKDGHGQRGLFRVLKAYTQYQPDEGYCQAQGPVAAVLLMNMPAEEAFWCLVQISEQYLPGYYSQLLEGVLFDAGMLSWVLKRTCPPAYKHLQRYGVEPLMFATDWLMCLFTRHLPFNTLLRVWDVFFCYGVRVLFQVAVVLVRRVLGRADQRAECSGQMETLERLRGVRESLGQEDDASFMAEVCSVPLSRSDLKRHTEKELETWRKDRPSSTFDPRGRCHGYWASRGTSLDKQDPKGEFTGAPSCQLTRSASMLSLSLHRKRWGMQREAGRVERHHSMGVRGVGRESWAVAGGLSVTRVEEEEEHTAPGKLQSCADAGTTRLLGAKGVLEMGGESCESQSALRDSLKLSGKLKYQEGIRQLEHRTEEELAGRKREEDSVRGSAMVQVSPHCSEVKERAVGDGATESPAVAKPFQPSKQEKELVDNRSKVPEEQDLKDKNQTQAPEKHEMKNNNQSQVHDDQDLKNHNTSLIPEDQELKQNNQSQEPDEDKLTHNSQIGLPARQLLKQNNQSQVPVLDEQELKPIDKSQVPEEEELKQKKNSQVPDKQRLRQNKKSQVPDKQRLKQNNKSQVPDKQRLKENNKSQIPGEQELEDNTQSGVQDQQKCNHQPNQKGETAEKHRVKSLYEIAKLAAQCETLAVSQIHMDELSSDKGIETQTVGDSTEEQSHVTPRPETLAGFGTTSMHAYVGTTSECAPVVHKSTIESTAQTGPQAIIQTEVCTTNTHSTLRQTNLGPETENEGDTLKKNTLAFQEVGVLMQKGGKQSEEMREEVDDFVVSTIVAMPAQKIVVRKDSCDTAAASYSEACAENEAICLGNTLAEEATALDTNTETEPDNDADTALTEGLKEELNRIDLTDASMCSSPTVNEGPLPAEKPSVRVSEESMKRSIETVDAAEAILNPNTCNPHQTVNSWGAGPQIHLPTMVQPAVAPCVPISTNTAGPQSSTPSVDLPVRKSSSSHGSRLARRLSEDIFTAPQTSRTVCNQNPDRGPSRRAPSQTGLEANPPGALPQVAPSPGMPGPAETTEGHRGGSPEGQLTTPEPPKRAGFFSRLRAGHPPHHRKDPKAEAASPQKRQIPQILLQDFSSGVAEDRPLQEAEEAQQEEQEQLSSRERRRRRRKRETRDREEEKVRRRTEKELKKGERKKDRRGSQQRKDEGRGGEASPSSSSGPQDRYSSPFTDTYF